MSAARGAMGYRPTDRLHLWLLTQPQQPILIGELHLDRSTRGVSLRYTRSWLERGFPLSEDLPLVEEEFLPAAKKRPPQARWTTRDRTAGANV